MVRLLDKCMEPKGVQISIGSENPVQEIETCSLITSTYSCRGRGSGRPGSDWAPEDELFKGHSVG